MQLLRAVWSFGSNIPEMVHLWKIYCLSILEQSSAIWGSSLSQDNKNNLERTQKSFAKLVLREKYKDYESALRLLDLDTLEKRGEHISLRFVEYSIKNNKLNEFFKLRETEHQMDLRNPELYRTTKAKTERFRKSSILAMQRQLNTEHQCKQ